MAVSYKEDLKQHIKYPYIILEWRPAISGILKATSADNTIILSRLEAAPTILLRNIEDHCGRGFQPRFKNVDG